MIPILGKLAVGGGGGSSYSARSSAASRLGVNKDVVQRVGGDIYPDRLTTTQIALIAAAVLGAVYLYKRM